MKKITSLVLTSFVLLGGCASVIEGRSQELTVNTTPPGASCSLQRNGVAIGSIASTPDTIYLEKTKDDISIMCHKTGYQDATIVDASGYPKYNWAYILVGGPVGWGVDSATGSDNEYMSPVTLDLQK